MRDSPPVHPCAGIFHPFVLFPEDGHHSTPVPIPRSKRPALVYDNRLYS
jgi:hypothetical protein